MAYWETARAAEMSPREDIERKKERKKAEEGRRREASVLEAMQEK